MTDSILKPEYKSFLDNLREWGVTNMFGAGPYLQEAYPELSKDQARKVLTEWMRTFNDGKQLLNE